MADGDRWSGGRPASLAPFLSHLRRHGVRVSLTGGHALDLLYGIRRSHKDVDLLLPIEDLPALVESLPGRRYLGPSPTRTGGMVVTDLGYTDLLTGIKGPDGLWRPSWRPNGVPWPAGHPFDHWLCVGGYTLPVLSAPDMLLRVLADFGVGSPRHRTEGALLERLLTPGERSWLDAHLAEHGLTDTHAPLDPFRHRPG